MKPKDVCLLLQFACECPGLAGICALSTGAGNRCSSRPDKVTLNLSAHGQGRVYKEENCFIQKLYLNHVILQQIMSFHGLLISSFASIQAHTLNYTLMGTKFHIANFVLPCRTLKNVYLCNLQHNQENLMSTQSQSEITYKMFKMNTPSPSLP